MDLLICMYLCLLDNTFFMLSFMFIRISYSVYEIQRLQEMKKENVQLIVMYDVACILSKHLKVPLYCLALLYNVHLCWCTKIL